MGRMLLGEAERLILLLEEKGWRVAVAESCTGGLLCAEFVKVPGASKVLAGGVVAYSRDAKRRLLNAPDALLDQGMASPDIAAAMARGAAALLGADVGIAATGAAGPDAMDCIPPGEVYVGVVWPGGALTEKSVISGSREDVMRGAVEAAIAVALSGLAGQSI